MILKILYFYIVFLIFGTTIAFAKDLPGNSTDFPPELVNWQAYEGNPIFNAGGKGHWDVKIRERGYILKKDDMFHLWYTGYDGSRESRKALGYATSTDGYEWETHPGNPIYTERWTEDIHIVKVGETFYMVAEGRYDIAHMLTSPDGINWTEQGSLDIRMKNGEPIKAGPRGTPTLWVENNKWYLFYERNDSAIWLATSKDQKIWTNVQDDPVLSCGNKKYDRYAVALNQVIKYKGIYYAYYHASDNRNWDSWSINIAKSKDLIHWTKYSNNPIIDDKSSGIVVFVNNHYLFYAMHETIDLYIPSNIEGTH